MPKKLVRFALPAALAVASALVAPPVLAVPAAGSVVVARGAPGHAVGFVTKRPGEVLADVTAAAPGVSWGTAGHESSVLSIAVDGKYVTDDVVPASFPIRRSFAVGHLAAGRHTLTMTLAADRSTGDRVQVRGVRFRTVAEGSPSYTDLAHAPVLYGRDGTGGSATGPFQNASTDTPLVAWHEDKPAATVGHRILTYSYIWSNEDGGTSTPQLMARWGRTTDIEWIYQVEVDAAGKRVPGTAVIQSPNHVTLPFNGTYEGDHPLLQTCTLNNNICDQVSDPMRFSLAADTTLDPATQAREQVMDRNPWTYWVADAEARREGHVQEAPPTTSQDYISDPRNYLYLVVRKQTGNPANGLDWVGLSIGVKLKGDDTLYRSDHEFPDRSLQRDDPAATTVELPPGTTPDDIAEITALRVPGTAVDTGATIQVQAVNRAFFLGSDDRPGASFLSGATPATLTPSSPTATLYKP